MNDRPSVWGYGLGLGMAVTGGVLAVHVQGGTVVPQWWVFYPSLIVAVMGVVVGLSGLGHGVTWGLELAEKVREYRASANDASTALVESPEAIVDEEPDTDALEEAWYVELRKFFRNGEVAGGFSHSRLVESGRTLSEGDWTELTSFYASKDGGGVLRLDTARGYVLNHGMTFDTIRQAIVRRSLPHPAGSPPEVVALPNDATRHDARRHPEGVRA